MLEIINKANDTAEMYISGDIVDDTEGAIRKYFLEGDLTGYEFPQKIKDALKAVEEKELTIYINSHGGDVFAGVALSNMIERRKSKTTCIVDGVCASIATQIFFAGDVCKIPANCYLMIHKPESLTIGNADELRKTADTLDKIQKGLEVIYNENAKEGITAENITELVNSETWLTGEKASEYFNIEVLNPVKVVNCFGSVEKFRNSGIKNIPSNLNFVAKTSKNEVERQKIKSILALAKGALI